MMIAVIMLCLSFPLWGSGTSAFEARLDAMLDRNECVHQTFDLMFHGFQKEIVPLDRVLELCRSLHTLKNNDKALVACMISLEKAKGIYFTEEIYQKILLQLRT